MDPPTDCRRPGCLSDGGDQGDSAPRHGLLLRPGGGHQARTPCCHTPRSSSMGLPTRSELFRSTIRRQARRFCCHRVEALPCNTVGPCADNHARGGGVPCPTGSLEHDRRSEKVSLERYRRASEAIFDVLATEFKKVERASIDECYVDLSAEAANETADHRTALPEQTFVAGDSGRSTMMDTDTLLVRASFVVARARATVKAKLGYTMSAGVAHNKMLAKLASARNKPDKVTLVPYAESERMLCNVRVLDINGFGGKLGQRIAASLVRIYLQSRSNDSNDSNGIV